MLLRSISIDTISNNQKHTIMENEIKNKIKALIHGPYGQKFDIEINGEHNGVYVHLPQFIGINDVNDVRMSGSSVAIQSKHTIVTLFIASGTTHTTIF